MRGAAGKAAGAGGAEARAPRKEPETREPEELREERELEGRWLVARWMTPSPRTLGPADTVGDALELMTEHRIRHVPIVEDGLLAGIVSDRDVRHALPLRARHPDVEHTHLGKALAITLGVIMTRRVISIDQFASIREAGEIICREKIGALPVVEDERLIGIISSEDVLWALLEITRDQG